MFNFDTFWKFWDNRVEAVGKWTSTLGYPKRKLMGFVVLEGLQTVMYQVALFKRNIAYR